MCLTNVTSKVHVYRVNCRRLLENGRILDFFDRLRVLANGRILDFFERLRVLAMSSRMGFLLLDYSFI